MRRPRWRRGLGELLAALIVAAAMTSIALAYVEVVHTSTTAMREAGERISLAAREAGYPPVLSVGEEGSSLYLYLYPQAPVKVDYIVYIKGGETRVIRYGRLVDNATRILLDSSYDCQEARVILVLDGGVAIPYSPARDPRVLRAAYNGDWSLLEKTSIDCQLLQAIQNSGNTGGGASIAVPLDDGGVASLLEAQPPTIAVDEGNQYTVEDIWVHIEGSIGVNAVNLTYNLTLANSGEPIGSATITVLYPTNDKAVAYIGSVPGDQGQEVRIYAAAYCDGGACVAGIIFSTGEPTIYYGEGYGNMSVSYTSYAKLCDLGPSSYLLPGLIGQVSPLNSTVTARCEKTQWWSRITMKGEFRGYFTTTGPLVLLLSTHGGTGVALDAWVWLRETDPVKANASSTELPCQGPIKYWLTPFNVTGADPLSSAFIGLYGYEPSSPLIEASFNGATITREVTRRQDILPLAGATYTLVVPPYTSLPFYTTLKISYRNWTIDSEPEYTAYGYQWNLTTAYEPHAYMQPVPYVVHLECIATNQEYIAVAPPGGVVRIVQGGIAYKGLALLVGGLNASLEAGNATHYYALQLQGSIDTGLQASFSVFSNPSLIAGPSGTTSLEGLQPGYYLIAAAPPGIERDPSLYAASLARIY